MQQEEIIPESKKYRNQKNQKQHKISVQLITQTSLDQKILSEANQDQRIEASLSLKVIHLQWLSIRKIQNLEVFSNLNVLYLQNNKIQKIENLECLLNLQYLALNDNQITVIQNISTLKSLRGLNLSNNQIQDIEPGQLPKNVQILSLKDNPVAMNADYKVTILKQLTALEMLDGITIAPDEKLKILGKFPQRLLSYSENLKHFRSKKQIKKKLDEQELPIYLGGTFDQAEALKEMRQKTRKHMHLAKEGFANDMKDQNQNFQQKIKISRKIRNFKESEAKKIADRNQIQQVDAEDQDK